MISAAAFLLQWFLMLVIPSVQTLDYRSNINPPDTVKMINKSQYVPIELTISKGESVLWLNDSRLVHTVTCDPEKVVKTGNVALPAGADPFDSGNIEPGDTYLKKFDQPGTYKYFCIPHEMLGMVAIINVE